MAPKQSRISGSVESASAKPPNRAWRIVVMGLLGLAFTIAASFIIKRELFPTYWTAEELGPIQINASAPHGPAPDGMVWIPGGIFWMGSDHEQFKDAGPVHKVYVDGFWMDKTEVTNAQFARFIEATGYVTVVERSLDPKKFPGYDVSTMKPFSLVFQMPEKALEPKGANPVTWWQAVAGASWKHPEGPASNLVGRENYPAVHICYEDAETFARWANKRLPTEAQWEFASRGGLDKKPYTWGVELKPQGKPMANTWQGEFPHRNTLDDGYLGTAPVGSFPENGFGLHDMAGNVWEWCSDWYQPKYMTSFGERNPTGPKTSHDPAEPGVSKRVQRGGSFLCCENYCVRFMAGGRGKGEPESTANHIGFRCVR